MDVFERTLPTQSTKGAVRASNMRYLPMVVFVFATLASANQGHGEENRGSAEYLLPLCKTWLDLLRRKRSPSEIWERRTPFD
jgi:hypothetical protein